MTEQVYKNPELDQWMRHFTHSLIHTWQFTQYRADEIREMFFVDLRARFESGQGPAFAAEQYGCNMRRDPRVPVRPTGR